MVFWGFSSNIPIILNTFLYVIMFLMLIVAVIIGWYAARNLKAAEKDMPADAAYEEGLKARQEKKAAKKALKAKK
ncbi:MAG: hypothetical protein FWD65_03105 [Coriobacteriia bacterium]|nr:hypothetical protein [Coriobacteriia bacterium]